METLNKKGVYERVLSLGTDALRTRLQRLRRRIEGDGGLLGALRALHTLDVAACNVRPLDFLLKRPEALAAMRKMEGRVVPTWKKERFFSRISTTSGGTVGSGIEEVVVTATTLTDRGAVSFSAT